MARCVFAVLILTAALQSLASQTRSRDDAPPAVSILLPSNVPSGTVQILYFMVGPFGGSGGRAGQRTGLDSYEIAASVEGRAATEIKIVVYASGCEMKTFAVPVAEVSRVKKEFECHPVRTVTLSGQVMPNDLIRDKNAELVITYLAFWAYEFFGIVDGPVAEIRLATIIPDANGMFQVDLPDFGEGTLPSSSRAGASLHLMLRDSKTWNRIAPNLEPELVELRSEDHGLRIGSDYPSGLKFTVWPSREP